MIISHKYKFIFLKTRKTAGTSIEVFLSDLCGSEDILTAISPAVEGHYPRNYTGLVRPFKELKENGLNMTKSLIKRCLSRKRYYNHMPASLVKIYLQESVWNSYFKFCVERNPWDKTLSYYHMIYASRMSFEEYLDKEDFCINYPIYTDKSGYILVDKVLKYENLNVELASVFSELGIPFSGKLEPKAKSGFRRDRTPYQEIYSSKQRKIIEDVFQKEIQMHQYTF